MLAAASGEGEAPAGGNGEALADAALLAPLGQRGPAYLHALEHASVAERVGLWLEIGDTLAAQERLDRATLAWERGVALAESSPATRTLAASFYWRLGQLSEGQRAFAEAAVWYGRAADAFHREGAHHDEAMAAMAEARVVLHDKGAGEARQHARDAVVAARQAAERQATSLLGEALELAGEIELDLGQHELAIACLRDAVRQHERLRTSDETGRTEVRSSEEVRALVALAEALLEAGQPLLAVRAYESVEGLIESHESSETRGRGLAVEGLLDLELGRLDQALEPLGKAHECLQAAGATWRRARLFVATAQRVERQSGAAAARPIYEKGWLLSNAAGDPLRIAPVGYALARCCFELGDAIAADHAISQVLRHLQDFDDVEGLVRCTELAVRIAIRLAQGKLALERIVLLARSRARMGDRFGAVRTFLLALEAAFAVPDTDTGPIANEFMELLREVGTAGFGPAEVMATAEALVNGDYPEFACEIATMEAERHVAEGRQSEAARTLARAATWATAAHDASGAVDFWDRALHLGQEIGMAEVAQWKVERSMAAND